MNETEGRSQIVQTMSAQFAGTKKLQSLTAKSSSDQKVRHCLANPRFSSQRLDKLQTDAIPTGSGETAESAVLRNIRVLL
jgi:hypothetical protein